MTLKNESLIKYIIETSDVVLEKREEAQQFLSTLLRGVQLLKEVDERVVDMQFIYEDIDGIPLAQRIAKLLDTIYVTT